jgi:hypothetical protein
MGLVAERIEHGPNSDPAMVVIKSVNAEYQIYQRMAEEVHVGRLGVNVATALKLPQQPTRAQRGLRNIGVIGGDVPIWMVPSTSNPCR